MSPLALPEARRLLRHAPRGGALIELGAGNGRFLERLRRCGWEGSLEGLEFDPDVAAAATRRLGVPIRWGDINDRVLDSKAYDVIVLRHVIEHVRHPVDILKMVFHALRPGGVLFVGTPDNASLCARVFGRHWWGYEVPRHLVIFSGGSLAMTLDKIGFGLVDRWSGFSPQMWNASIGLLLADQGVSENWCRLASSPANPLTIMPFSIASLVEVACGRSTMLSIVAKRPV